MEDSLLYQVSKRSIELTVGFVKFIYFLYLLGQPEMRCDEQSTAYQHAHSLTQERLERIYLDLKGYALDEVEIKGFTSDSAKRPMEFEDLEYTRIIMDKRNIKDGTAIIRLNFCFDQSIDLELKGILSDEPVITLAWGELERTEEILWQK